MQLASLSETLTVLGQSPLVDTASSQVAGNVDRRQMEELPVQGRNWMELSKLIKGITANDVGNTPGVSRDDDFQLNLDGQQITQKIAGSGFGQPKFSREAIAEFQIVTNMFDITQGRSAGIQVQAISRSGTNKMSGALYGFFRDDKFNAKDAVANRVLPYQNQQLGGAFGGPIVKDKTHYFASYEYEREPGTLFTSPSTLPGQSFTIPYKNSQQSILARVDRPDDAERSLHGARIALGLGESVRARRRRPSVERLGADQERHQHRRHLVEGAERFEGAGSPRRLQQLRVDQQSRSPGQNTVEYNFVGLIIGKPYNYPQLFYQDNIETRYDLSWHTNKHDIKFGGEFIYVRNTGTWYIQQVGRMLFNSNPANLNALVPERRSGDLEHRRHPDLDGARVRPELPRRRLEHQHPASDVGGCGSATTGASPTISPSTTACAGTWTGASRRRPTSSPTRSRSTTTRPAGLDGMVGTDFGYKDNIRDNGNIAPRVGFTYNVGGKNDLVDPRRHRPLLHDAGVEHDVQPADLQPDGDRGVPAAGQRPVRRRLGVHHQSVVRRDDVRAGQGRRAAAVAAHHQPRLQEPVHLAEQHRLPEADQLGDRLRSRPDALQRIQRHAHDRSEPVLQPGDRLQP